MLDDELMTQGKPEGRTRWGRMTYGRVKSIICSRAASDSAANFSDEKE